MSTHICMWLCLHAGCYLRGQQSINQGRARIRLMCIRQVIRTQMKRTSSSFYWVRNFLRSFKELGNTKVCVLCACQRHGLVCVGIQHAAEVVKLTVIATFSHDWAWLTHVSSLKATPCA